MKNDYRQSLHLEPKKGWLNDPNGLCYFKGEYHVYFQYCPDSAEGKSGKCWGHFKSPDMINWQFTGTVLFPDTPDDKSGVYSGCGFVKDDTLHLFYTGNVKHEGDYDYINSGRGANVMLVTTKDGHNMSEKQILLRNSDYPDYCSCHVRDPKVWEENGQYRMVLGARTRDSKGCVLYYKSNDLVNWEFDKTLYGNDGSYMWECPDEFCLGEHRFLSASPQGIAHQKYIYQNVYSAGYFNIDSTEPKDYREWDCGFDFYAPQSFDAPDGRKILIGWQGIGDIPYYNPTVDLGWQHCLTLPRELTVSQDGFICQQPVRELEGLRVEEIDVADDQSVLIELPFELDGVCQGDFLIKLSDMVCLTYKHGELSLIFTSDIVGCDRTIRYAKLDKCESIRVIADKSSLEIFINDGETVMSSRMYPPETEVELTTNGITGKLYKLDPITVK